MEVQTQKDVLILFPKDHMEYGLGTDIYVEIKLGCMVLEKDREKVAEKISRAIKYWHPPARVKCEIPRYEYSTICEIG